MAKNGPKGGGRKGAVKRRTQVKGKNGWIKRNSNTGQFMDGKSDGKPFKGVTRV